MDLVGLLQEVTPDDFNKVALGCVAVVTVITGPLVSWLVVRHQTKVQADIAKRAAIDNVSAKRQQWIDGLRDDAAEYLANTTLLSSLRLKYKRETDDKHKRDTMEQMLEASAKAGVCVARIELRINPTEMPHQELMSAIRSLETTSKKFFDAAQPDIAGLIDAFRAQREDVVGRLQKILKEEWNRVRDGR